MTIRYSPISLGAPGEEISKKDLHAVIQRFKHFNQSRLQRVQDFFQVRQRDFLNLLPLIFHINHPLLPGFVSSETPAGIPDYTPNKMALEAAKQFSKGFVYNKKALRNYPIFCIFLMGSAGSMAFSRESDLDIWLCYQPSLPVSDLAELRRKSKEAEKWAKSLKIEAHFFLIDCDQFKRGENTPISADSSGETQHYLLLEEFYRTSIYIAGRIPVWWLVPPAQENNYDQYVAHLLENRFISAADVVDFGGLQDMPAAEFVSATLWHIYKSLTYPHKSLLKLLLMESYADEFPDSQWLCEVLKQAIYQGNFSVDSLDPYLLIYGKVESYLQQDGGQHRLSLARECFHLKIMGIGNTALDSGTRQLRESYLQSIAQKWHWPPGFLENLGLQKFWTIQKARVEHEVICTQLQQCLQIILKIAGGPLQQDLNGNKDLKLVSRKLQAGLDIRPGKVEVLTTRSMVHAFPQFLCFAECLQAGSSSLWRLYSENIPAQQIWNETPVKQAESLLELMSWAVLNGLYQKGINFKLLSSSVKINGNEFSTLLGVLNDFLSRFLPDKEDPAEFCDKPDVFSSSLVLINLGESLAIDANERQFVMSERSDPFSYGENRLCLLQTVEKLSVSSWGEVTLQKYSGLEGFFSCVCDVFNNSMLPLDRDRLSAACFSPGRGRSIVWRINTLFENFLKYFANPHIKNHQRYILVGEGAYYVFRRQDNVLGYYRLENNQQLLHELGSAQPYFSQATFAAYVLEQTVIPLLYSYNLPGAIQVFCHDAGKSVAVYVLDEKGALFISQHFKARPKQVLLQYAVFLGNLVRQAGLAVTADVQCYEVQKNSSGVFGCVPVEINKEKFGRDFRVRIVYEQSTSSFEIFFNESKFSIVDAETYKAVKYNILSYRKNCEDYPCYITEIDVPYRLLGIENANQAQTVHYLRYKQKIEDKLNLNSSATESATASI